MRGHLRTQMIVLAVLGSFACDPDPGAADGAVGADGGRDAAVQPDRCAADVPGARSTVGCNGSPVGASPAAGSIGGGCVDDSSCTGGGACVADATGALRCEHACAPTTTYVSSGTCPPGSRCFTLSREVGRCFRDCATSADCLPSEACDMDGSCVGRPFDAGPPAPDAGPAPDGGGLDGATGDGSVLAPDAGA